jgi:hypothetical protein
MKYRPQVGQAVQDAQSGRGAEDDQRFEGVEEGRTQGELDTVGQLAQARALEAVLGWQLTKGMKILVLLGYWFLSSLRRRVSVHSSSVHDVWIAGKAQVKREWVKTQTCSGTRYRQGTLSESYP